MVVIIFSCDDTSSVMFFLNRLCRRSRDSSNFSAKSTKSLALIILWLSQRVRRDTLESLRCGIKQRLHLPVHSTPQGGLGPSMKVRPHRGVVTGWIKIMCHIWMQLVR